MVLLCRRYCCQMLCLLDGDDALIGGRRVRCLARLDRIDSWTTLFGTHSHCQSQATMTRTHFLSESIHNDDCSSNDREMGRRFVLCVDSASLNRRQNEGRLTVRLDYAS